MADHTDFDHRRPQDPLRAAFLAVNSGSTGPYLEYRVGVHGVVNPDVVAGVPAGPTGVMGESNVANGTGVLGVAQLEGSTGVYGRGRAVGVLASSLDEEGIALEAHGRSILKGNTTIEGTASAMVFSGPDGSPPKFSTAGSARVGRNQASKRVTNAAVTPASNVLVTLQANPGDATVKYVQAAAGSFTLFLTEAVGAPTRFGYVILA